MAGSTVLFSSTAATQAVRGVTTSRGAAPSARLSFAGRGTQSNALRLAAPRRGAVTKGRSPLQVAAVGPVPGGGLQPELRAALDEYVNKYKVVVFMKGTAQFPQCGFSNTVVQILNQMGTEFQAVNILEDDSLRMGLKEYSAWPTFPQVYIEGEFFGGCDIMIEEYQNGNLKEVLEKAMME